MRWKLIHDCSKEVEISDSGLLRLRKTKKAIRRLNATGYRSVSLKIGGISKVWAVHRLVYETFKGKIAPGLHINHINRIRHDNRLLNLEPVTPWQNIQHARGKAYKDLPKDFRPTPYSKLKKMPVRCFSRKAAGKICGITAGSFVRWADVMGLRPIGYLNGRDPFYFGVDVRRMSEIINGRKAV